jgi:SAM-dependent methyltransferase
MAIHAAVFLVALSGLIFEVSLTRIYSATIWYHFAFMAISVALLGWGLGGVSLHLARRRIRPSPDRAAICALLYAACIVLCLWIIVEFPFRPERLALYFIAPLLPFFLAGIVLSTIFHLHRERSTTLYLADLGGAALGALSVTFLLELFGGETTVLIAALAPAVAAGLLSKRYRLEAVLWFALLLGIAFFNGRIGLLHVAPGTLKAMQRHMQDTPGARVTQTGWNAYSRIDAVEGFAAPVLARLYIDSDAWTNVQQWDGRMESIRGVRDWFRAFPFRFTPHANTLVIGPGGGSDVIVALGSGSRRVTAVELNPLMIQFVRHYGARAGNLYDRPDVEVIQSEGRTFISRTDRKFDLIFMGFVDTWASVASGGLSLSENYLYTTQALRAYYEHLTDDGLLAIARWSVDVPRLFSNSVALLGRREASERIVVLLERHSAPNEPPQMMFILRKRPFSQDETAAIMTWPLAEPLIVPGRHADPPYADVFSGRKTMGQVIAEAPQRMDPVFDDSPFYFATERPWGIPYRTQKAIGALVLPVVGLLGLFVLAGKPKGTPVRPYAASILYFASLGAGFIAIELTLLQHLTLLLGHPIFTLSILLFTILAAGGAGSALSNRVPAPAACFTVAILGSLGALALPRVVPALLPLALSVRVAAAVALTLPLGAMMGMPFPKGLLLAGEGALPPPPFYWGLNGIMSVIGSITTVFIALVSGFQVAMLAASVCYMLAAAAFPLMKK